MGLLHILRKNKSILRKIFGEAELKIIERQILGINLTQSEKNILSRSIRKKFKVIGLLANVNEEDLKKGSEVKRMINGAKDYILDSKYHNRIKKIILFGSTIKNQRTFRSDIDIAVEFDEISLKEATGFRIKMHLGDIVDVQVYNVLPEKIRGEIDREGRVIYERKDRRKNK